jgi:hypothetical protein
MGAATFATFIAIWPEQEADNGEVVATINGRILTRQDILDYKDKDQHHGGDQEFMDEIITKQLLISEAQRLNIDKEPDFRRALKTFYEHTLIKILMEEVNQDIKVEVSDEEVSKYLDAFGKTFTFYTLDTTTEMSAETIKERGKKYTSFFDDLSGSLQQILIAMQPGEMSTTFVTGNEKTAVYLENIEGESEHRQNFDREQIRRQLLQAKIEKQINTWIKDLRERASITYHTTQE